jgi:transcriptional regulator with XRE-family HTH domain
MTMARSSTSTAVLGRQLRKARKERGLSQEQLAERAHMRQATLSEWETGKLDQADPAQLKRVCKILGIPRTSLMPSTDVAHTVSQHAPRLYRAMAIALARRAGAAALVLAGSSEERIEHATNEQVRALFDVLKEAEHHKKLMMTFDSRGATHAAT